MGKVMHKLRLILMSGGTTPGFAGPLRLVALDLDGVVWRGGEVILELREALEDVLRRGLDLRYVSNNSTAHREDCLRAVGEGRFFQRERTGYSPRGPSAAPGCCARLPEGSAVMVVGEQGLLRETARGGLDAYQALPSRVGRLPAREGLRAARAAVVWAWTGRFQLRFPAAAQAALGRGRSSWPPTTMPPSPRRRAGAGHGVHRGGSERRVRAEPFLVGKPSLVLAETLSALTHVSAERTLFVGAGFEHDHRHGESGGMTAALSSPA